MLVLADNDVRGAVAILRRILESGENAAWLEIIPVAFTDSYRFLGQSCAVSSRRFGAGLLTPPDDGPKVSGDPRRTDPGAGSPYVVSPLSMCRSPLNRRAGRASPRAQACGASPGHAT